MCNTVLKRCGGRFVFCRGYFSLFSVQYSLSKFVSKRLFRAILCSFVTENPHFFLVSHYKRKKHIATMRFMSSSSPISSIYNKLLSIQMPYKNIYAINLKAKLNIIKPNLLHLLSRNIFLFLMS